MLHEDKVLGVGQTAQVVGLEDGKVAKLYYDHISSVSIEKERLKSSEISLTDLLVPEVYGETVIQGKRALIYEHIKGLPLTAMMNNPFSLVNGLRTMATLHTKIHSQADLSLPLLTDFLETKIQSVKELSKEEKLMVLRELTNLPDEKALCHGDFHPDNVLITPKGPVTIDWLDATVGNPVADVARTTLLLKYGGFSPEISPIAYKIQIVFRKFLSSLYVSLYRKRMPLNQKTARSMVTSCGGCQVIRIITCP
ncbi:phosphotransferase family protein [Pseudalkalibacillus hwajinpoensis]|uniref:Aminoglycoside phosphotransferase family protein n=1 Tax=Guptibacillus hwajinpoensis TaxID=208199 RepID=A0A4U1MNT2_9BACL|nr:aminoglycoside phosphotransferase family protein [Pseudalkalibacillus hwajinpoensis]TKD72160.1 aminoglycoside phosphotransferase family protein [Pseudalkalibacillus hwajinpoensis]